MGGGYECEDLCPEGEGEGPESAGGGASVDGASGAGLAASDPAGTALVYGADRGKLRPIAKG